MSDSSCSVRFAELVWRETEIKKGAHGGHELDDDLNLTRQVAIDMGQVSLIFLDVANSSRQHIRDHLEPPETGR